jgi:GMP synthase (glutamine-hydrolysing)
VRVGLLQCDHVPPELESISGDYDSMFRRLFAAIPEVEIVPYDAINGVLPGDPGECDAWMTTGSRHSVNDPFEWIRELEQFVRDIARAEVPFVGICFGHQLLAKTLGGEVGVSDRGWGLGVLGVDVDSGAESETFAVFNMHSEQVVSMPDGAESIGRNDHCPVWMMTVGPLLLGIQGHPEMDVGYGGSLIRSRRGDVIPEKTADVALKSLVEPTDSPKIADLIVRFIDAAVALGHGEE